MALNHAGCGADLSEAMGEVLRARAADGDTQSSATTRTVILDWTGGSSRIYPGVSFPEFDFREFPTPDGRSLADDGKAFQELVRARVETVLLATPGLAIEVRNGEAENEENASVVHLTQAPPPRGGSDVGEGEYDLCDREPDNRALVFAANVRTLGDECPPEEWALIVANVCAHEIGHMLGFGHVTRSADTAAPRDLYVEIMLDGHTPEEMRREQRFLAPPDPCGPSPNDTATPNAYTSQ
jgi:hypothetical protein